jgi:RNA-binding protein 25
MYPPPGVFSHQRPPLIHGIVDPVTMTRPPVPPVAPDPAVAPVAPVSPVPAVAPVDTTHFKIYIGKIAATVDNDFVLSLLQVLLLLLLSCCSN